MTKEELETAKQLAAHPNFRPSVGMRFVADGNGFPIICTSWTKDCATGEIQIAQEGDYCSLGDDCVPDISHPATKGCLLALARELWDSPRMLPETRRSSGWVVYPHRSGMLHFVADSEGIALARAVIKAPK